MTSRSETDQQLQALPRLYKQDAKNAKHRTQSKHLDSMIAYCDQTHAEWLAGNHEIKLKPRQFERMVRGAAKSLLKIVPPRLREALRQETPTEALYGLPDVEIRHIAYAELILRQLEVRCLNLAWSLAKQSACSSVLWHSINEATARFLAAEKRWRDVLSETVQGGTPA